MAGSGKKLKEKPAKLGAAKQKVAEEYARRRLVTLPASCTRSRQYLPQGLTKPARKALSQVFNKLPRIGTKEEVMLKIQKLSDEAKKGSQSFKQTLQDLGLPHTFREVMDRTDSEVLEEIECVFLQIIREIKAKRGFSFEIPSRARTNQMYVAQLDRIVLKDSVSHRPFGSLATNYKAVIMTRVLQIIMDMCRTGINTTKRDLFYQDVKLFQDQTNSDSVLDDLACMLSCTRTSLHVVGSEKGIVVGNLRFRDSGDLIDCTRMGTGGKGIPNSMGKVSDIESDAAFILLVEKDAAFMRLSEDRFYNSYPCIMITAKGQPDVATRMFLRKLKDTLKIPILALVDSDVYGLKILSVYMKGSMAMSYDSANLTTPDIKWLGVRPSDLAKFGIPEQTRLPMSDEDMKTGKKLMEEDFIKANPAWVEELEIMMSTRTKFEIQALSSLGIRFLSETYLPLKLQQGDWI